MLGMSVVKTWMLKVIGLTKKIKIALPESNTTSLATLLEDVAPKTCQAVWDVLPFSGQVLHAKWCGNEIWTRMPRLRAYEPENATIFPKPGDIFVFRVGPDMYDLAIFYGTSWCFGPSGFFPGNRFATISENLDEFARGCDKVLREGSKKIVIEKAET